jgi:hypothetical protein
MALASEADPMTRQRLPPSRDPETPPEDLRQLALRGKITEQELRAFYLPSVKASERVHRFGFRESEHPTEAWQAAAWASGCPAFGPELCDPFSARYAVTLAIVIEPQATRRAYLRAKRLATEAAVGAFDAWLFQRYLLWKDGVPDFWPLPPRTIP